MKFVLDSVILIDHCNGIAASTRFIEDNFDESAISAITRAEVLAGFAEDDVPAGVSLLDQFHFLTLDAAVADAAARLRRRSKLKLPDAIQAAFAVHHGLKLATRNSKDFTRAKFDFVEIPYRLP